MNPAIWICIFLPIFLMLLQENRQKKERIVQRIIAKRKDKRAMLEFMQNYLGKECLIYTMNSQLTGTVRELADGWLLLDNGQSTEAVNLDYIIRIREYPKDKKGKKKSVVLD